MSSSSSTTMRIIPITLAMLQSSMKKSSHQYAWCDVHRSIFDSSLLKCFARLVSWTSTSITLSDVIGSEPSLPAQRTFSVPTSFLPTSADDTTMNDYWTCIYLVRQSWTLPPPSPSSPPLSESFVIHSVEWIDTSSSDDDMIPLFYRWSLHNHSIDRVWNDEWSKAERAPLSVLPFAHPIIVREMITDRYVTDKKNDPLVRGVVPSSVSSLSALDPSELDDILSYLVETYQLFRWDDDNRYAPADEQLI
jgi:hypothetical protein